ncbi:endonuclease/exonuclease/phosphatase [Phanerochaete sordida]|uniref:Endonuclease/exonuclease/phosphatase n=1 Tax=Phanerochaete sordida TaxID=48140 RepID=A0A9P3L9T9_9APHY|nr:endonuclease/exonuclease/phosphatase [Phanerochaete sordida]
MSTNRYELTPEQLALAEARKLKKLEREKEQVKNARQNDPRGRILERRWLRLQSSAEGAQSVKVMTWNMLAQTLVRRELFPESDCLKASQREHMLYTEILSHRADICCLQEVDRTEKVFPVLGEAGYSFVFKAGPRKKHGSVIAFSKDKFELVEDRQVFYDETDVRQDGDERGRKGSSFFTKNIANLVALRRRDSDEGFFVGTTHLFWHPRYTYERARQIGILFREITRFREELAKPSWPCLVAGDFNFQPDDAAYALLVGDPLLPAQRAALQFSRVVHRSRDPSVPAPAPKADADEDGEDGSEGDPDRVITNARAAVPSDGLLSDDELAALFAWGTRPVSAYDAGLRTADRGVRDTLAFGSRVPLPEGRRGACEPAWTSYTHYWKTVLDYIFVLDPPDRQVSVLGLAEPFPEEKLVPGLPRKGVCGSDHISLSAELAWDAPTHAEPRSTCDP